MTSAVDSSSTMRVPLYSYREIDPTPLNVADTSQAWINLGLWRTRNTQSNRTQARLPTSYADACSSMCRAVGTMARMKPGDSVADFGCGRGESLILWKREYGVARAHGVNISPSECAAARCKIEGLNGLSVSCGDAVQLSTYPELAAVCNKSTSSNVSQFNVAVAVDSCYHFDTRAEWLRSLASGQACLRPGGRVACADIILSPTWSQHLAFAGRNPESKNDLWSMWLRSPLGMFAVFVVSKLAGVPVANLVYSQQELVGWMEGSLGMTDVCVEDVTSDVFIGFARHMVQLRDMKSCSETIDQGIESNTVAGYDERNTKGIKEELFPSADWKRFARGEYWMYTLTSLFFHGLAKSGVVSFVLYSGTTACK